MTANASIDDTYSQFFSLSFSLFLQGLSLDVVMLFDFFFTFRYLYPKDSAQKTIKGIATPDINGTAER